MNTIDNLKAHGYTILPTVCLTKLVGCQILNAFRSDFAGIEGIHLIVKSLGGKGSEYLVFTDAEHDGLHLAKGKV